jgi:hypothetical protein
MTPPVLECGPLSLLAVGDVERPGQFSAGEFLPEYAAILCRHGRKAQSTSLRLAAALLLHVQDSGPYQAEAFAASCAASCARAMMTRSG